MMDGDEMVMGSVERSELDVILCSVILRVLAFGNHRIL